MTGAENGIIKLHPDGKVPLADFVCWANKNGAATDLLACVEDIGHVCLGLKPEDPAHEGRLLRDYKRRFDVGELVTWQVLSSEWWREWSDATTSDPPKPIRPIDNSSLLVKGKSESQKVRNQARNDTRVRDDFAIEMILVAFKREQRNQYYCFFRSIFKVQASFNVKLLVVMTDYIQLS